MSEFKIRRKGKSVPVVLTTSVATAQTLRWDDVAGGMVFVGTVATAAATINVYAASDEDQSFYPVYNADGTPASITLASSLSEGRAYALPDAAFGASALRLVAGEAAGTAADCRVTLKT